MTTAAVTTYTTTDGREIIDGRCPNGCGLICWLNPERVDCARCLYNATVSPRNERWQRDQKRVRAEGACDVG